MVSHVDIYVIVLIIDYFFNLNFIKWDPNRCVFRIRYLEDVVPFFAQSIGSFAFLFNVSIHLHVCMCNNNYFITLVSFLNMIHLRPSTFKTMGSLRVYRLFSPFSVRNHYRLNVVAPTQHCDREL